MVDKQTRQMKEEKWGRHVGKNPRLGSVSSNRHLRYQLARRLHHSKAYKNVNPRRRYYKNQMMTVVKQPLTTRDKLKNIWNSVKLLFKSNSSTDNDDVYHGFESGISSNDNVHYSNSIAKAGSTLLSNTTSLFTREDSSRSTIDTTLEYMPVEQENVPLLQENSTTHGNNTNTKENRIEEDPRDEVIAKLKNQVALLKKKVKYAREKNTLYKSLLDEANIGTTYLESRRHIKNLVRDNMKPDSELPPSPERKVYPLVTSSPIRQQNIGATHNSDPHKFTLASSNASQQNSVLQAPPQIKSYYSKYPKLPHTESLIKREPSTNHENIKEQHP